MRKVLSLRPPEESGLWYNAFIYASTRTQSYELSFISNDFSPLTPSIGEQMTTRSKHEAAIPNPALKPLSVLIGEWTTVGTHGLVPDTTFHGRTSFEWLEGGAFLMMRSEIDEPGIPSGIAIFGSDDDLGEYFMLY